MNKILYISYSEECRNENGPQYAQLSFHFFKKVSLLALLKAFQGTSNKENKPQVKVKSTDFQLPCFKLSFAFLGSDLSVFLLYNSLDFQIQCLINIIYPVLKI